MIPDSLARAARVSALVLASALGWACTSTPELALEHLKRGDASLAEGNYAQALAAYGHARELAPSDPGVQRAMIRARVHLIAENAARIGPDAFEDARYEASLLLDTDKTLAPVCLTALGNILARQGDVEGAKAKFAEALKADPTSALAHTALGVVLMSRKEGAAQAKLELELALKVKPADLGALVGLGQLELAEGDVAGAVGHLEAALRVSDSFDARMALGNARVQQQKPGDAAPHFQRAAQLDPKSADAMTALGQALLDAGKPEDAERALRAATQMRPDLGAAIALGFALARQKKAEAALGVFSRVLAEDATAAPALYGAGTMSEELGRTEQAVEYYRRLLAFPPAGPQRQMLMDLQREAQSRVAALAAAQPSASASASATAAPVPLKPPLKGPLDGR
jgi:tetratricopeptide (TPR) repeat protein